MSFDDTSHAATARLGLRRQRRPLAYDVRDVIARELILNGEVPPGEKLPSEHQLSARYGVSRVTVRAALHGLREAGLISIRQGVGATVLPRSAAVVHGLDRLGSIDTFARESGAVVSDSDVSARQVPATADVAERLHVAVGDPIVEVSRVKCLDGERVAWIVDHLPAGILPYDTLVSEMAGSALDVLLAHPEVRVEYADAEHTPVKLSKAIADRLDVKPGTIALFIDTVVWTDEHHAAAWGTVWLLPEHFRFVVRRRRPVGE
ncbi:MAG TPA: GntR family transcriptional regulator [Conexibacter sp.]|nr:GntR family transcriptional regulator [Conexibacter sp.]